jgi:hypothetical protein
MTPSDLNRDRSDGRSRRSISWVWDSNGTQIERFCFRCPSEAAPTLADICGEGWWPDGGLREAELAQITRSTLFDVSWPQGGNSEHCPWLFLSDLVPESCSIYQNIAQLPPDLARWLGRV